MDYLALFIIFANTSVLAANKTLCGRDDRVLSYDQKIARTLKSLDDHYGCTATLISNNCAITAGHCIKFLKYLEFNVAPAVSIHQYPVKQIENIYEIEQNSILYEDNTLADWAVFKVKRNRKTHAYPGELYGYYDVSFWSPLAHSIVTITGYGKDNDNPLYSYLQQIAEGEITAIDSKKKRVLYRVDTMGGNSGASVISQRTGKIVAIHTNGGCDGLGHSNYGTLIGKNKHLRKAIKECIKNE